MLALIDRLVDPRDVTEGDLRRIGRDPPGVSATERPQAGAARLHAARQQDPQPQEQANERTDMATDVQRCPWILSR